MSLAVSVVSKQVSTSETYNLSKMVKPYVFKFYRSI